MDPTTPKVRVSSDGNHLTKKPTLPCSPTESETPFNLGLQEIVSQSVWLRSVFRFLLLLVILHI